MSNPAYIVDGFTELRILQKLCPGSPVRRTDLNGRDVTLEAISERIASYIRIFNDVYYPIIILVDKENRDIHHSDMAEFILEKLNDRGHDDQILIIGVADRMIENWVLADWANLPTEENKPNNTDGINGYSKLKNIFGSYTKTTDTVELFCSSNPEIIYQNSDSFKYFADAIIEEDIDCDFLNF